MIPGPGPYAVADPITGEEVGEFDSYAAAVEYAESCADEGMAVRIVDEETGKETMPWEL